MRVAVLSDIHANLVALDAVLGGARQRRRGLAPRRRRRLRAGSGRGRRPADRDRRGRGPRQPRRGGRSAATRSTVQPGRAGGDGVDPHAHLPGDPRLAGARCPSATRSRCSAMVHGSPREPLWEYIVSVPVARANLALLTTPIGLFGHTHLPMVFVEEDGAVEQVEPGNGSAFALERTAGAHQPRQRRPAARRDPDRLPHGHRHRRRALHLVPGRLRRRGRPGRDARRRPPGPPRPTAVVRPVTAPMIGGRRPLQGRKLGDRRIRVERPHAAYFRWTGPGQLTAKESASGPTTGRGRALARVKAMFLGRPLASEEEIGERLSKKKALAIFSSDAISSSAYATEEILRAWSSAGSRRSPRARDQRRDRGAADRRRDQLPPGLPRLPDRRRRVLGLEAELRPRTSLVAASALLIDYVMTVAVSTSSAVEQITSAFPALLDERVLIGVVAIALITIGNLRGLREAGNIFAAPDVPVPRLGAADDRDRHVPDRRPRRGHGRTRRSSRRAATSIEAVSVILILRAFASGSVALTGTEAIATGVQAFKPPESRNAATTLAVMAVLLGVLFIGITFLAVELRDRARRRARAADGHHPGRRGASTATARPAFFLFQAFTALLLVPRREHELHRVPAAARDPRRGRLHAPPVLVPRRPPRVLVGDHRPGDVAAAPGHRGPGRDAPADPALRGRRVHRLHDQPDRHDPPLAPRAVAGLAAAALDQRPRGRPDRRRRGRRDGRQGAASRCSCCCCAAARRDDDVHPPPVHRPGGGAPRPRRPDHRGAAPRAAGRHPGQRHQPGRRPGRELRAVARDATSGPSTSPRTPMRATRFAQALGAPVPGHPARHRRIAVPRA